MNHQCQNLPEQIASHCIEIRTDPTGGNGFLRYMAYATEEDVRAGEAGAEGELLTQFELAIRFCPYCGAKL